LKIVDAGEGHWGFRTEEIPHHVSESIEATSIDELMRRYELSQVDLLKVNVEGAELDMFEKGTDAWLPHTKAILIELHDRFRPGCSKSFTKALMPYCFTLKPNGSDFILCRIVGPTP
jgi:hypothetical protein